MKKITLCGEYYNSNFGDGIIVDSSKYILEQINEDYIVDIMDFSCRKNYATGCNKLNYKNTDGYRRLIKLAFKIKGVTSILNLIKWFLKSRKVYYKYYNEKLKNTDILIFSGGHILVNNSLSYPLRLFLINKIALKNKIKIIFNSCGSEKTKSFIGRLILNKVLNSESVKVISVRDNIENIEFLSGEKIKILKDVYESNDPAVLISKAYNIEKKESNTIGLGVISHLAYVNSYSRNRNNYLIGEEELLNKWIGIIKELDKRGYNYRIFSNGGYHDNAMAYRLQKMLNNTIDVFIPKTPYELVHEISKYKGIIAHRLHANIIAYSLKVPSVGLVWDTKLIEFGKKTGRSKFYINLKQENVNSIVNLLEEAIQNGVDEKIYSRIIEEIVDDFNYKLKKVQHISE